MKKRKITRVTITVPSPKPIEKVKSNYFNDEYNKEKRKFLR
jgi:hypothetical protein